MNQEINVDDVWVTITDTAKVTRVVSGTASGYSNFQLNNKIYAAVNTYLNNLKVSMPLSPSILTSISNIIRYHLDNKFTEELDDDNSEEEEKEKVKKVSPEIKMVPIGLTPRFIVVEKRLNDIVAAMNRYTEASQKIPVAWIKEYNDLINWRENDMRKEED